ncbi:hypothetical protein ACLB2K_049618 [Fragaria x ananassa]
MLVNTHSCLGIVRHEKHKKLGSKVISSIIVDKVKFDPLIKPTNIVKNFKEEYGLVIPYYMAYRGKDSANDLVNGSEALGYALLPSYIDALKRSSSSSSIGIPSIIEIFQFSFAVVDEEANWNWFLEHLTIILMTDYHNIVFMSDRGRGLLDCVKEKEFVGKTSFILQGGLDLLVKMPDQCNANAVINLATTTASHALQLYEQ